MRAGFPAMILDATFLRHLLDESPSALLGLDEHGTVLELNAAAAEALTQDRRLLVGKPLTGLIDLSDRGRFRVALLDVQRAGTLELDLRLAPRADRQGRQLRLRLRSLPELAPAISARLLDDEEERPPDAAAQPSSGALGLELERVLLRLPLAVIGLDRQGKLVFANARARRLFKDIPLRRGKPLPDLGPAFPLRRLADGRTLVNPPPGAVARLADGRSFRLLAVAARADLPGLLVFDDISATLAQAEHERTFLRDAAHQMRTPLAGIASAIEVLQSGAKDDPEARERFLGHIERESERLDRLTRALLVLARAQAGVQTPRLEFVSLEPLLSRVTASLALGLDASIEVSCRPGLAAFAEPDLLGEALAALIENGVKHAGGKVRIRAWPRDDHRLEIEVSDEGEGILPERLGAIFEPFSRGDHGRDGFGLGLAIARDAVAAMDGQLQVRSEPGHGTCFSFTLPSAEVVEGR